MARILTLWLRPFFTRIFLASVSPYPAVVSFIPFTSARLIKSPVSFDIPNVPSIRLSATSSDVCPHIAVSTSWMEAALFIATCVMTSRLSKSTMIGESPTLMTCAPIMRMTGFFFAWARTMSFTRSRNSLPMRMRGSESAKSLKLAFFASRGMAKSFGVTLLLRSLMEIVLTPLRSICLNFVM